MLAPEKKYGVSDNAIRKWQKYYEKQFNKKAKSHMEFHTAA